MEIKFNRSSCRYLQELINQQVLREETQELHLPDGMPDIGRILGCWGQCVIRNKEWRNDGMSIGGGVMAWVLYAPEDGSEPRSLETWIPFQQKWELPQTERDGFMCVVPKVKNMDARSTSARKLMLRVNISTQGRALEMREEELYQPETVPEDVQLLKKVYPMELLMEFGEKMVQVEEEWTLPDTYPAVEKILRYELTPLVAESKVMTSRFVFCGNCKVRILYCSDGKVHAWDGQTAFSQYAQLDREYSQHASGRIAPVWTNLELTAADGKLRLKASMTAQFSIYDRQMVTVVEDAYSTLRSVQLHVRKWMLPVRLDEWEENVAICHSFRTDVKNVVDIHCMMDHPRWRQNVENGQIDLAGQMQVLYYNTDNQLQSTTARLEQSVAVATAENASMEATIDPSGPAKISVSGDEVLLEQQMQINMAAAAQHPLKMVTGLDLGEMQELDPTRPSIILRRCEDCSLWEIAKSCGSTVDAIREANGLDGEPEVDQMLLIPVT